MAIFAILLLYGVIAFSIMYFFSNNQVKVYPNGLGQESPMALHVVGNRVVTGEGVDLILHGVDYTYFIDDPYGSWMLPSGDIEYSVWDTTALAANLDAIKSWGFNSIRILATTQWWAQNSGDFQSHLEYFIKEAASRKIYVDFTFWRNNGLEGQPSLPYPPYDDGNGVIKSENAFVNLWASVSVALKSYPNVLFELWNEPNGDKEAQNSWFNVTQKCIDAIRDTGASNIIVLQWDYNTYLDFRNYSELSDSYDSKFSEMSTSLHDSRNNIIYSTHLYSTGFYDSSNGYSLKYSYSDMLWALNVTGLLSFSSKYPVWIGEIGCSLWASNINDEYAWYNNTLSILNQNDIGYCGWAWAPWSTGTQWELVTRQSNYVPSEAGKILQQRICG